jgi:hypothetical protein
VSDSLTYYVDASTTFFINICGPTTTECNPQQAICQKFYGSTYGYGSHHNQRFRPINLTGYTIDQGITIEYRDGGSCSGGMRGSIIHVVCHSEGSPQVTSGTVSMDDCTGFFTIKAAAGCGKKVKYEPTSSEDVGGGIGAGGIILILLCVGVVVYLVAGGLFNWKMRGATTVVEAIPQYEFWRSVPGLVKDGVLFIAHGFKKGDYVSV